MRSASHSTSTSTRTYADYGIDKTSIETPILPYDTLHGPFSAPGNTGAIILDRAGRIVALLTSGTGKTGETDIIYGPPLLARDADQGLPQLPPLPSRRLGSCIPYMLAKISLFFILLFAYNYRRLFSIYR